MTALKPIIASAITNKLGKLAKQCLARDMLFGRRQRHGRRALGAKMHDREDIARRYGFESFAHLLDISERLTPVSQDGTQSYLARRPDGTWFVWDDPCSQSAETDRT